MNQNLIGCLPEISSTGDFYQSEDVEVIIQSLYVILMTPLESRPWQPEFGCKLREYLWDLNDDQTLDNIKNDVQSAIRRWENRIIANEVVVERVDQSAGTPAVTVRVDFTFNRKDYSHTFQLGADTDLLNLSIYQLKIDRSNSFWQES